MKRVVFLWALVAAVFLLTCAQARAEVVGHLTQVQGRVDLLKGGKLPATPVKVNDTVGPKDVIRTKSLSKAQITLIDNSVITISPESRIAIEEYMFDPAKQKRSAVLKLFQGLAHVVVNKVFKTDEPDFVVKTHTAIMGVRGTDFGIRLSPNDSTILNFQGVLQVGNIFPEVGQLSRKASKVAYSFKTGPGAGRWVFLKRMQGTAVSRGLPPTLPFSITKEDRQLFMQQMVVSQVSRKTGGDSGGEGGAVTTGTATGSAAGASGPTGGETSDTVGSTMASNLPTSFNTAAAYTPPTVLPTQETPPPSPNTPTSTFSFSLYSSGDFSTSGSANITTTGLAIVQGDWEATLLSYNMDTESTLVPGIFPSDKVTGSYTSSISGSVSGIQGSTLSGSGILEMDYLWGESTLQNNATIQVTIDQSGQIHYTFTEGEFNFSEISGTSSGSGTATPVVDAPKETVTATTMAASNTPAALEADKPLATPVTPTIPHKVRATDYTSRFIRAPGRIHRFRHRLHRLRRFQVDENRLHRIRKPHLTQMAPRVGPHRGPGPGLHIAKFKLTHTCGDHPMRFSRNFPHKAPGVRANAGARPCRFGKSRHQTPGIREHHKTHHQAMPAPKGKE
ncbi:MAG: FecR family protein [Deltaproteobacteria bacterium]